MRELSPQPGRTGRPTRHTPPHRTRALAQLIILSYAAKVESTVIAKRDVTLVMPLEKKKKEEEERKKPTLGAGEERGELRNK